jgi:Fe-S cluster assembly protein SufD
MLMKKESVILETNPRERTYKIARGAHLTYILAPEKGWNGMPTIGFVLEGPGARLDFLSLILGQDKGKYDFRTQITHGAKDTVSRQSIRSAMYGESSTCFEGMMLIEKGAVHADAHMSHKSLLMSPKAKSNASPSMEILADDVKAGHSSGTGKPDKDALFYLESRGIKEDEANALLANAFFTEIIDKIPAGKEKGIVIKWLQKFSA